MHLPLLVAGFLLFSVFAFSVSGLRCRQCSSSTSFEDCIKQRQEIVDCDRDYKCGKFRYKSKKHKEIYSLSCSSNMHCNDPAHTCRISANTSDCELTCCDTDLCNPASLPLVSRLVVLACVLGMLMMT